MAIVEYKYIGFVAVSTRPGRKTGVWNIYNRTSGIVIGQVRWYGRWRSYCFLPEPKTIFSPGCLTDIQDFLGFADGQRKAKRKAERESKAAQAD